MHHQKNILRAAPVGLTLALVWLILSAPLPARAAGPTNKTDKALSDLQQRVGRLRGLTLAILKQLKEHDAAYRGKDGKPLRHRVDAGRQDLSRTKPLVDAFQTLAADVPGLLTKLRGEGAGTAAGAANDTSERKANAVRLEADFKKYKSYVDQFWSRAVGDFGPPPETAVQAASLEKGRLYTFTGEANLLLGTSRYKRPGVQPVFKSSATDFGFGVAGKFIPHDNTSIDLNANYKKTVERREIGLSNFGVAATHIFSPKFTGGVGADFAKYTDEDAKVNGYSENGVFASAAWTPSRVRLVSKFKWFSRGYGEIDGADYGVTTFNNDLLVPAGKGDIRLKLNYLKQSNDAEVANHSDFNPAVLWRLTPNGTEMGIDYRKLSYPNFDDCPLESNRTRLSLLFKSGSGTTTKTWGPEVVLFSYPNVAWGRGIAEAACRDLLARVASEVRGDEPLLAVTQTSNQKALALAGRLGFVACGEFVEFGSDQQLLTASLTTFDA